jgi:hypothetical protein
LTGTKAGIPAIFPRNARKTGIFPQVPEAPLTSQSALADTAGHWERLTSNSINVPALARGTKTTVGNGGNSG